MVIVTKRLNMIIYVQKSILIYAMASCHQPYPEPTWPPDPYLHMASLGHSELMVHVNTNIHVYTPVSLTTSVWRLVCQINEDVYASLEGNGWLL